MDNFAASGNLLKVPICMPGGLLKRRFNCVIWHTCVCIYPTAA